MATPTPGGFLPTKAGRTTPSLAGAGLGGCGGKRNRRSARRSITFGDIEDRGHHLWVVCTYVYMVCTHHFLLPYRSTRSIKRASSSADQGPLFGLSLTICHLPGRIAVQLQHYHHRKQQQLYSLLVSLDRKLFDDDDIELFCCRRKNLTSFSSHQ